MKKRIVIFASGSGTNAQNIIEYFRDGDLAEVVLVLSNKKDAFVLERAKNLGVDSKSFTREELYDPEGVQLWLSNAHPDLIVLAGFLWMFPKHILEQYPNRVINIHPALLPKYGGKGMYGSRVHEAVVAHHETETGITIHYVNEHYDEGAIIYQTATPVLPSDTPDDVAHKVHELEYEHFPKVIAALLESQAS